MIGLIFPKLSVEVVGSEQGVQPGTGQFAIDRTMGDAVGFILGTKQRMTIESPDIVRLVVGDENQRVGRGRGTFEGESVEDIAEGTGNAARLRLPASIEVAGTLSLRRGHGS